MTSTTQIERELLSIVAHDLKTPISAVRGFIELVHQTGTLNDQQRHFMDRALLGLDRMQQLVMNLMDFAQLDGGIQLELDTVEIGKLVEESAAILQGVAFKRGIQVHVNIESGIGAITADERLLSQVVNNLLGNAVKYNRDRGDVRVNVYRQGQSVRVDVTDTGVGIAPDEVLYVFDRFYRVQRTRDTVEGSGLGLSIAEMIVKQHGGRIWVESVLGEGSTFSFTVPTRQLKRTLREPYGQAAEEADGVDDRAQDSAEGLEPDSQNEST